MLDGARSVNDPAALSDDENWTGGFYELAIERGDRDDARLEAALQRAWADHGIDGCLIERNREPDDQSRVAPTLEAQNKSGHLRGIADLVIGVADAAATRRPSQEKRSLSIPPAFAGRGSSTSTAVTP